MHSRLATVLSLLALAAVPTQAQDVKTDKPKAGVVSSNPDAGRQHLQISGGAPPATGNGARPAQLVQPQLDDLEKRLLALEALVDKQKSQLASLGSTVSLLQQDNNKLWAKAVAFELLGKDEQTHWKEYLTHQHNPGTLFGQTLQGNFHMVFVSDPNSLNARTSGPLPGK